MAHGERLRDRRAEVGWSQAELAQRADVSRGLVSAVEAGRHQPGVEAALALARALGTTAEALFGPAARGPLDVLTGAATPGNAPVRVGRVGDLLVTTPPRLGDEGWDAVDGRADDPGLARLASDGTSVVVAGCEPSLALLERMLREQGTRAIAVATSNATALAALAAGRVHAAALHFRRGAPLAHETPPVLRFGLARWRVGLAAPQGLRRDWWRSALSGRRPVVQREAGAAAQQAFEAAVRVRRRPIPGPRVGSHLAASRSALAGALPGVTIEPAAAAVGAAFHALETHDVELWIRAELADEPGARRLLEQLGSAAMRRTLECVGGYDLSSTGRRVA